MLRWLYRHSREVTRGRRRRFGLTPLENPLCIHAFVGVTLKTDPTVCFITCRTRGLRIYLCRWVKPDAESLYFTCISSSPWTTLVVVSCFPLSFLMKTPFIMSPSMLQEPCRVRCDLITASVAPAPSQLYPAANTLNRGGGGSGRRAGFCVVVATRKRSATFTYWQFRPVCQAVLEGDAQGEVYFQVAEIAVLLDVKGVSALLDGNLQVVVRSQLPLDQVNSYTARKKMQNSQWAWGRLWGMSLCMCS